MNVKRTAVLFPEIQAGKRSPILLVICMIALGLMGAGKLSGQAIEKGMAVLTQYADSNNTSNPVARLYDTRNNASAPRGMDWYTQDASIDLTPSSWTLANMGEVFGIAIDSIGDVFFGASDIYHLDSILASGYNSYRGPAGAAGIYKADAAVLSNLNILISTHPGASPQSLPATTIPNTGGIGNGIGNLAYDRKHHQIFATNLEDGRIYRIDLKLSPPQVVSIYDPLSPDNGNPGMAPRQEQLWGVGVFTDSSGITRVYFARRGLPPSIPTEIRSIPLQSNGEFGGGSIYHAGIYEGGSQLDVLINTSSSDTSKITDIAFAEDGRMLLAERGHPHRASVYEYIYNGNSWVPTPQHFYIGAYNLLQGENGTNAAGGIDYGYRQRGTNVYGHCDSTVWATSNYMITRGSGSGFFYGLQGIGAAGNLPVTSGTSGNGYTDWHIDTDGSNSGTPQLGDVEIYRSSCATSWSGPINHVLACNDLLQVSLGVDGTIRLNADIVTQGRGTNPCWVFEIFTPDGTVIPGALLQCEWVGQTLNYQVRDTCNNNSCWGEIKLEDKYIPPVLCGNDTVPCHQDISPDSIGFPVPASAIVHHTDDPRRFIIDHWDSCGAISLWYSDEQLVDFECGEEYKVIVRKWNAEDAYKNTNRCFDTIRIRRPSLAKDLIPVRDTILYCGGSWARTASGAPAPEVTGRPILEACDFITSKYKDDITISCGEAFRVLRKWTLTDWCADNTHKVKVLYQTIEVRDTSRPLIDCPGDKEIFDTISTGRYGCTANYQLPKPNTDEGFSVFDNCSDWKYRVRHIPHRRTQPGLQDWSGTKLLGNFRRVGEAPFFATNLDLGMHWFEYEIVDDCNNKSSCVIAILVADKIAPDIVCEAHTQVSLTDDGLHRLYAISVDDGTTDNCELDSFAIRRFDHKVHCGQSNKTWNAYITFCCEDVGKTISVELLAVDKAGNTSICMVDVDVDEKIAPVIVAPTDLTIDCRFYYEPGQLDKYFGKIALDESERDSIYLPNDEHYASSHKGFAGIDGLAYDNCGPISIKDTAIYDINCGSGTIVRHFTVIDAANLKSSATQTITIEDLHPFSEADIHWPEDVLDPPFETDCTQGINTDPSTKTRVDSAYGFRNLDCARIGISYTDKYFYQTTDACYKIVRTWTIIDWCTYDKNKHNEWVHTQLIKVANHTPPQFTAQSCNDTVICDSASFLVNGVCSASIHLSRPEATDDCTPSSELKWSYRLDEGNTGSFGEERRKPDFRKVLPLGVHRIKWMVEDGCGNVNSCIQTFEIRECKPPTPYCRDEIVTVVMSSSGTITVPAKSFDIGAKDNCTAADDLIVSFTEDGLTPEIVFTCADLNGKPVLDTLLHVYFIDQSGNSSYCEVHVKIQANKNCESNNLSIAGKIQNFNGEPIPDVRLTLYPKASHQPIAAKDFSGTYRFEKLRGNRDYEIHASKQSDWLAGVNTRDLVIIKKYLLNKTDLEFAWQYIAADANNSNSISTADIAILRQLILGKRARLPKADSWVWFDDRIDKENLKALQEHKGIMYIEALQEELGTADWSGIKVGDVSGDVNGLRGEPEHSPDITLHVSKEKIRDQLFVYHFISGKKLQLEGLQGSFHLPGKITAIKGNSIELPEQYYALYGTVATLAWSADRPVKIARSDTLFSMMVEQDEGDFEHFRLTVDDLITRNMVFPVDGGTGKIQLTLAPLPDRQDGSITLYPNRPNPARLETYIRFENPEGVKLLLQVFDLSGREIFKYEIQGKKGFNSFRLPLRKISPQKGILFYTLKTEKRVKTGKIIVQ